MIAYRVQMGAVCKFYRFKLAWLSHGLKKVFMRFGRCFVGLGAAGVQGTTCRKTATRLAGTGFEALVFVYPGFVA